MGKPIAGRNKTPFGIGGINVDAAVLKDGTKLTNIKVSKQKSSNLFDLISTDGVTLYRSLKITTTDKDGLQLLTTDSYTTLANKLAPGTFCISVFDTENDEIIGYALKLQLNKIILGNGNTFYISNYNSQDDTNIYVTGVTLNKTTSNVKVNLTEQLTATVVPTNATTKTVTWTSSAPSVATVSNTGLVTGISNGSAIITVTTIDGSKTASCSYTVTTAVTGVDLTPATVTLSLAGTTTQQLTATVAPTSASNKAVTYVSSAPNIATVSSTGLVTAVSAGSATITVTTTDGSFTDTTAVTVNA